MNKLDNALIERALWITTFAGLLYFAIILPFTFYVVYKVSLEFGLNNGFGLLFIFGQGMCTTLVVEGLIDNFKDIYREYKEVQR